MAIGDFISAAVSANGVVMTTIHEGGAGLLGTLDATKLATINLTSEGYGTGTVLSTVARVVAAVPISKAASGADTAITWHLIHKAGVENDGSNVYDDDTAIIVTYAAGVLHTAYTTAAVTGGAVTNNSTKDYPKAKLAMDHVPRQKYTGTLTVDFLPWAKLGVAKAAVSLTDSGAHSITKTYDYSDLALIARRGAYGPAAFRRLIRASFNIDTENGGGAFDLGVGTIEIIVYPRVGDADSVYSTATSTFRPKASPDCEEYLDPGNTESARDTTVAYVDSTSTVPVGAITGGPYTDREFAVGGTSGAIITVIGAIAASPIRFNYSKLTHMQPYSVALDNLAVSTPQAGEAFEVTGNPTEKLGVVVDYNVLGAGVLRYIVAGNGAAFADNDALFFHDSLTTAQMNGAPSAINATVASGEVVTGTESGATSTTSATPMAASDGSGTIGDVNDPYPDINAAIGALRNSLGTRADGGTIYLKRGDYVSDGSDNGSRYTAFYYVNVTRAPGLAVGDVRIMDYTLNDGNWTQCIRFHGLTIWQGYGTFASIIRCGAGAGYDASGSWEPVVWMDDFIYRGWDRLMPVSLMSGFDGRYATNYRCHDIGNGFGVTMRSDCLHERHSEDLISNIGTGSNRTFINMEVRDITQGPSRHADVFQIGDNATVENIVIYGFRGVGLVSGQMGPYWHGSNSTTSIKHSLWLNVIEESMSNSAFLGPGVFEDIDFVNCTFNSTFLFENHSDFAGDPVFLGLSFRRTVFSQVATETSGGAVTLYPAWFDACHFRTTNDEPVGVTNSGTGETEADLFAVINDDDNYAEHYVAKLGGALDSVSGELPFPYDIYGAAWPTNGSAAIGAAQPAGGGGGGVPLKVSALKLIGTI